MKDEFLNIETVSDVDFVEGAVRLTTSKGENTIPWALNVAREHGLDVKSVSMHAPTLEDVFIKYTGRRLRDETEGKKGRMKRAMGHRRRLRH